MQVRSKKLRMVRARLSDDEFLHLKLEEKETGASISSIIRDALTERRLRLTSMGRADCCKEQP